MTTSLNALLATLGMSTEPSHFYGRKRVLRKDGSLFLEGDAHEVWEALREAALYPQEPSAEERCRSEKSSHSCEPCYRRDGVTLYSTWCDGRQHHHTATSSHGEDVFPPTPCPKSKEPQS